MTYAGNIFFWAQGSSRHELATPNGCGSVSSLVLKALPDVISVTAIIPALNSRMLQVVAHAALHVLGQAADSPHTIPDPLAPGARMVQHGRRVHEVIQRAIREHR